MNAETVEGFRLSPRQRRLWSLEERDGGNLYRAQCVLAIRGELPAADLEAALSRVVRRHEILRTTFRRLPGMESALQVVADVAPPTLEERVVVDAGLEARGTQIQEALRKARARAPDLGRSPLLSAILLRFSRTESALILSLPAICADAATLSMLAAEIAIALGRPPADRGLAAEPMQYADVAEWENDLLEKPESAAGLEYWARLDLESPLAVRLPFAKRDRGSLPPRFESVRIPLSTDAAEKCERLGSELDADPAAILLACWQALLWRLAGRPVVVGYATQGRRFEELKGAMGPCGRSLPLSIDLDHDPPFAEAVASTLEILRRQEKWEEFFTWDTLPRRQEADALPFFPFLFDARAFPPLSSERFDFLFEDELIVDDRFDVRLTCVRTEIGWTARLDYDALVFAEDEMKRLSAQFALALESAVARPQARISEVEILGERERLQILAFNGPGSAPDDARPIVERFEEQASLTPEAIALVAEDRRMTYGELDARANRLANFLRSAGVGPETVVALCADRSVEMIAGLLGIWKAGGAYLPLDPALPVERLAFMLEETGAALVLAPASLADRMPATRAGVHRLDEDSDFPASRPERSATPANLAYVIFTSGSTGRPKGVEIEHRQLSHYVRGVLEKLRPPAGASFATVSTLAADLGNTAIFPALATGGRLHLISESRSADPEALAEYFDRHGIDYLKIVPSHLAALLSASRSERLLPRRALVLGGEPSAWGLIEKVRRLSSCEIWNHYGPTEATVGVTMYPVPSLESAPATRTVPVGRPLPNTRIFLLDPRGRPVVIGAAGELHVAGAGLARGYRNRPDLTAERFVAGGTVAEERLYRTGDLARYLSDGNIELLGRTDEQVKIHGHRIEPGEVEAVLRQCPGVREAVVLAREDSRGEKKLVAYVVSDGAGVSPGALRESARKKLPEFMVPAAFVALPRLPLTANGKIDRRALPAPESVAEQAKREFAAPGNAAEGILAKIWGDVLGLPRVGIHDNFFELGGDSILAIQIIARAARGGLRLTPRQLFERQTVAELAEVAEISLVGERDQEIVTGPVPLTPIQGWFFALELLDPHHFNQAALLEFPEAVDARAMEKAVALLTDHHDALRLRFVRTADGWRQTNAPSESGRVFSVVPVGHLPEADRPLAMEDAASAAQAGLNVSDGPLARAILFDRGPENPAHLLLIVHHLAVDGVSWRILLEDLETAYRRIREGQPPILPPKTTSFRQWAYKVSDLARSGGLEREAAYWLSVARRESPMLPLDAQGENTLGSARVVVSEFSEEETRALLQEVPAVYRTQINDALLAALTEAFSRWTGGRSLRIDLEGHGREDIFPGVDLSRTVGWFTARFPVLLELPEASDPGETLIAIKEQLRAIPQRGIGYGVLRYLADGNVGARWKALPEPLVSFNYLGQLDRLVPENSPVRVLSSIGPTRSARDRRPHLLSVEGKVQDGRLRFAWIYSENLHHRETIVRLADGFEQAVRRLLAHCLSAEGPGRYSPSDFPSARLSQNDLNKLLAGVQNSDPRFRR